MIRVRRHARQLGSGKTVAVRQHERQGMPRQDATAVHESGSWWDGSSDPVPEGDYPPGTSFFRQGDEVFAALPDGSVDQVAQDDDQPGDDEFGPGSPFTRETAEGTETLPVDPSVPRCAEDRGAWGGTPRGWGDTPSPAQQPVTPSLARMQDEMRHWRSLPEPKPRPEPPMSPQMAHAMGCGTPEGRVKYDRLRAYREAGYKGPLDQDNQIPDPDDPANHETLSALARMGEI